MNRLLGNGANTMSAIFSHGRDETFRGANCCFGCHDYCVFNEFCPLIAGSSYFSSLRLSMPLPMAMNVGAQRPIKIPNRSPAAASISFPVPPMVNQMAMLAITDKNPSP